MPIPLTAPGFAGHPAGHPAGQGSGGRKEARQLDVQACLASVKVDALAALRENPEALRHAMRDWSYDILRDLAEQHPALANLDEQERATLQARIWKALIDSFALGWAVGVGRVPA